LRWKPVNYASTDEDGPINYRKVANALKKWQKDKESGDFPQGTL
jgi:hypothetical protein